MTTKDTDSFESADDWWDNLSDAEKRHLTEGLDNERNGRIIAREDFWERQKNN
jgi:hypothetical protein